MPIVYGFRRDGVVPVGHESIGTGPLLRGDQAVVDRRLQPGAGHSVGPRSRDFRDRGLWGRARRYGLLMVSTG